MVTAHTFTFLADKMKYISKILKLILLHSMILYSHSSFAITGSEIKSLVVNFLADKGLNSSPIIKENRVFKQCSHKLKINPIFNDYKTVIVSCKEPMKWQVTIRTNTTNKNSFKKSTSVGGNSDNLITLVILKHNLKKGEVIQLHNLNYTNKKDIIGNGYFINFENLIGRKLKQNLSRGQVIKSRHLEENFMVKEGQSILIFSDLNGIKVKMAGNALQNGHFNELIKVKNLSSGKIIQGRIVDEKKIFINY